MMDLKMTLLRSRYQPKVPACCVAWSAPMDLNLISVFRGVAEAASFSAAAKKLGVRRSSISRSVAGLEKELGVQLFNRTTRSVALTTAGTALLAKVRPQLVALEEALGSLPEREEEPSGELRLTAPGDIGVMVLPEIIAGFSLRFPAVQVDVRLTNRAVDLVSEGFDVALRAGTQKLADSSLVARRLSTIEMQVFASPIYLARAGTPRSLDDAAEHEWVTFRGFKLPAGLAKGHSRVMGDDMLFVHRAVRSGAGLGLMPTFLAQPDVATGSLVRVLPKIESAQGALHLLHPPAQHVPRKVTAFRDYVLQHLSQHPLAPR
jgi:DNA-binding transcriptional LysR family regulator